MSKLIYLTAILLTIGQLHAIAIPIDQALKFRPISKSGSSWNLNINKFVDGIIEAFHAQIPDSMPLGEIRKPIHMKILFLRASGFYHLWNGKIWGLSSVHRTGNVGLKYDDKTQTLELEVSLGANRLWASYEGHAEVNPITMSPSITGTIPNLAIQAKVCGRVSAPVKFYTCGMKLTAGQANLSFHKMNLLNGFMDAISNMLLHQMQPKMVGQAEASLRKMVDKYLDKNSANLAKQLQYLVPQS